MTKTDTPQTPTEQAIAALIEATDQWLYDTDPDGRTERFAAALAPYIVSERDTAREPNDDFIDQMATVMYHGAGPATLGECRRLASSLYYSGVVAPRLTGSASPDAGETVSREQRRSLVALCWRKKWYPVEDCAAEIVAALQQREGGEG